ncbi:hypothetical protein [uncultured Desulfovibrio sp.]|uniref:hypothetical protein n=1 Tax=uncultured Desulfovibrio sp. TaxID=167968 RepID=UPI00263576C7|nr:hypothetical protein [uncultured Desulfovibrio sp.]
MEKPGCPFNHFGSCKKESCLFFVREDHSGLECLLIMGAYDASMAHAYSFFSSFGKPSDPYAMLFSGLHSEALEVRKKQIQCSLDSLETTAKLPHMPPNLALKAADTARELRGYLAAVNKALEKSLPRPRRKSRVSKAEKT